MPDAEWELFSLLTEVRRRVRLLKALPQEPRWVGALPAEDAELARHVLSATRAWAARSAAIPPVEAPAPVASAVSAALVT